MQRLSGMDASFLHIESSRLVAYIGSCVVLDPSTAPGGKLDLDDLTRLVQARMHRVPMFRRRLVEVPLGIGLPYWVDDPDFDLEFHLRESALPKPGTEKQLAALVARTFARPLDRRRPLWEFWLVHGLEGGRVALLTKFHHAVVDGVAGDEVLGALLDQSAEIAEYPAPEEGWHPAALPGPLGMVARGLGGVAADAARALVTVPRILPQLPNVPGARMIPGVATATRTWARVRGSTSLLEVTRGAPPPQTPFNGPLSGHLRWAHGVVSLDRVKAVKRAAGVTVNDVVVALCSTAMREWLLEQDALPQDALVAAVPISVRQSGDDGGNRIGMMTARIGTDVADPVERLRAVAAAMDGAKSRHGALPADMLTDITAFVPPAVAARAARTALNVLSRVRPPVNVLVSNVPGPSQPLFLAGAQMEAYIPVPPIMDGVALNFTVVGYRDELHLGVIADRDQVPDAWRLAEGMERALDELEAAVSPSAGTPAA